MLIREPFPISSSLRPSDAVYEAQQRVDEKKRKKSVRKRTAAQFIKWNFLKLLHEWHLAKRPERRKKKEFWKSVWPRRSCYCVADLWRRPLNSLLPGHLLKSCITYDLRCLMLIIVKWRTADFRVSTGKLYPYFGNIKNTLCVDAHMMVGGNVP